MECLIDLSPAAAATAITRRPSSSLFCASKKFRNGVVLLRAKLHDEDEDDPSLKTAIRRASLRFHETHRPEPLFVDPYAGCFVPPNVEEDTKHQLHQYCLATKFIDDKLLSATNNMDGLKQVVLLTDGLDTRPYRLNWPPSTMIFDISPEIVFRKAAQKLEGVGAKIPRNCLFFHVPSDSPDIQQALCSKGFTGNRPSIWAFQGLPLMTLASFKEFLFVVSNLAMKGCLFLGELPAWLSETEVGMKSTAQIWMDKLFMSHGFCVDMIEYEEVAKNLGKVPAAGDYNNMLFVAEHLRFSDDQMESWRREFQRMEEEADEEGFEEL